MLHQTVKLSANAQELVCSSPLAARMRACNAKLALAPAQGGDVLFKTRLGFSGTPSDLLPLELGHCHYAAGDDAKMLHILTSTENVT